jgi:hypothetical protein
MNETLTVTMWGWQFFLFGFTVGLGFELARWGVRFVLNRVTQTER